MPYDSRVAVREVTFHHLVKRKETLYYVSPVENYSFMNIALGISIPFSMKDGSYIKSQI